MHFHYFREKVSLGPLFSQASCAAAIFNGNMYFMVVYWQAVRVKISQSCIAPSMSSSRVFTLYLNEHCMLTLIQDLSYTVYLFVCVCGWLKIVCFLYTYSSLCF